MSSRIIKHSSRYRGPAGDSRPSAEIFAGMAARAGQTERIRKALNAAMDAVWNDATLCSPEGRIDIVWDTAVKWRAKHDLEFAERIAQTGEGRE